MINYYYRFIVYFSIGCYIQYKLKEWGLWTDSSDYYAIFCNTDLYR